MKVLTCAAMMSLATVTAWPIKTDDPSDDGANCDTSTEQYLQVEAYDFHDHPKITMRWTQITGACGVPLGADEEPFYWEGSYDSINGTDNKPNEDGRVQLNGFVCSPFGHYEIEIDVYSYSDEGSTLQQRTAWEIENGPDQYHIWDTVNTDLADDILYSPKVQGTYTWPLADATGYYKTIYAGPAPITECGAEPPSGTVKMDGCYRALLAPRQVLKQDYLELPVQGPDGMTAEACSEYCADYEYFGVAEAYKCYCGTQDEFDDAISRTTCGEDYSDLCTGDSTTACGGLRAAYVYQRVDGTPASTPSPTTPAAPTTAPVAPTAPVTPTASYTLEGCFTDAKANRVMKSSKQTTTDMTAEVCYGICDDGTNTHFGTQFANECWCGINPDLTLNGDELAIEDCDMACVGDSSEFCGGRNKITAYAIVS